MKSFSQSIRSIMLVCAFGSLMCQSYFLAAQAPFIQGYIVTATGDTVHGQLQEAFALDLATSVTFRTDAASEAVRFSPEQVQAFYFDGGEKLLYVSKWIEERQEGMGIQRQMFVRWLLSGRANLYEQQNGPATYHYYLQKSTEGDRLFRLEAPVIETLEPESGVFTKRVENRYLSALNGLLFDCPEAHAQIENTPFKRQKLIRLVRKYNECFSDEAPVEVFYQKAETETHTGIIAGRWLGSESDIGAIGGGYEFGIYRQFIFPDFSKNWFFEARLTYSFFRFEGDSVSTNALDDDFLYDQNSSLYGLPLLVNTRTSLGKVQFYLNGGPYLVMARNSKYTQTGSDRNLAERNFRFSIVPTIGIGTEWIISKRQRLKFEFSVPVTRVYLGYAF